MSKIKIYALGGLNEHGKNMYVVDVDNDLFVFDSGLKYADDDTLGIDYMIPNYDYLKDHENQIKGIFLTHGQDEQIGAIPDMLLDLKKVKVYGTKFTLDVLKMELDDVHIPYDNLVEIKPHKKIMFGKCGIFPIQVSHSVPDAVGYVLYTPDGAIFYTGNFLFDSTMLGSYKTDIGKLAYVGKQGVLCLLCESLYADKPGYTSPNHRLKPMLEEAVGNAEHRIICNMFSNQVYRMQEVFDVVSSTNRNVVIMSKRLYNIVMNAIDNKYINFDKNRIVPLKYVNDDNIFVITSDEREKAFSSLNRIARGYDKFTSIKNTDTIIFVSPVYDESEKTATRLFDRLARLGANLVIPPKNYIDLHASSEDIMTMINLMNPKYYMPTIGEYRHMVANKEDALRAGMKEENVILRLNGQVTEFDNGNLVESKELINNGDISIDGKTIGDIGELVIKDREALSDNGVVIVIATLDHMTKKLVGGPEVITKGFMYSKEANIIPESINIAKTVIEDNNKTGYVQFNKVRTEVRDKLGNYLFKETECRPMILVVLQEV